MPELIGTTNQTMTLDYLTSSHELLQATNGSDHNELLLPSTMHSGQTSPSMKESVSAFEYVDMFLASRRRINDERDWKT